MASLLASSGAAPYLLLFGLSVGESGAFLGLFLPGETFVIGAGALAGRGHLNVEWLLLVVIGGAVVGDVVSYALGRHFGTCRDHGILQKVWSCNRMESVRRHYAQRGGSIVFFGRFVGFLRPLVPFAAGATRMRYRQFLFFNIAGAIVWGTASVMGGYYLGTALERAFDTAGPWAGAGLVVALAVALFFVGRKGRAAGFDRPLGDVDEAA